MDLRRFGRLFQTRNERYTADVSAQVASQLGWVAEPGDDVSLVFRGRASNGTAFEMRASLFADDTNDRLEWRAGASRLDALLLAMTNAAGSERDWVRGIQVPGGLAHEDPEPTTLRAALNAKIADGLSPTALNDYALQIGAGGSDGVVLRFERSAVEVAIDKTGEGGKRLRVLAESTAAAEHLLAEPVRQQLRAVLSKASTGAGHTCEVFIGVPFAKMIIEAPSTSVEQLQAIAEVGVLLHARARSCPRR